MVGSPVARIMKPFLTYLTSHWSYLLYLHQPEPFFFHRSALFLPADPPGHPPSISRPIRACRATETRGSGHSLPRERRWSPCSGCLPRSLQELPLQAPGAAITAPHPYVPPRYAGSSSFRLCGIRTSPAWLFWAVEARWRGRLGRASGNAHAAGHNSLVTGAWIGQRRAPNHVRAMPFSRWLHGFTLDSRWIHAVLPSPGWALAFLYRAPRPLQRVVRIRST